MRLTNEQEAVIREQLDAAYAQGYRDAIEDASAAVARVGAVFDAAGKPVPAPPVEPEPDDKEAA